MVGQQFAKISPVQVGRQVGDSSTTLRFAHHEPRDAAVRLPHPRRLGRVHRELRNESKRNRNALFHSEGMQRAAERNDVRLFEALQNGMTFTRRLRLLAGLGSVYPRAKLGMEPQVRMEGTASTASSAGLAWPCG